jgi:alkylation response protein AidB-like acyl-CoA dehydrogenase
MCDHDEPGHGDLASRQVTRFASLLSSLQLGPTTWTRTDAVEGQGWSVDATELRGRFMRNYTIFEGTSEIQRLVIARAISCVHIK